MVDELKPTKSTAAFPLAAYAIALTLLLASGPFVFAFPIVSRQPPPPSAGASADTRIGVHVVKRFGSQPWLQRAALDAGVDFIHLHYATGSDDLSLWASVQPLEGAAYDWSALDDLDVIYSWAQENGVGLVLNITGAPSWARTADHKCSAIDPAYYDEAISFTLALMSRYPAVERWEIWNEEDSSANAPPAQTVVPTSYGLETIIPETLKVPGYPMPLPIFGCWARAIAQYWNYYTATQAAVGELYPQARIMPGGFMAANEAQLEPFLRYAIDAGIALPELAIHHYEYIFPNEDGTYYRTIGASGWPGGVPAKLDWLLAFTGNPELVIHLSETHALSYTRDIHTGAVCEDLAFQAGQADFLREAIAAGPHSISVYSLNAGWRCTNLWANEEPTASLRLLREYSD